MNKGLEIRGVDVKKVAIYFVEIGLCFRYECGGIILQTTNDESLLRKIINQGIGEVDVVFTNVEL